MDLNIGIGINLEMGTTARTLNMKIGEILVRKIRKRNLKMHEIYRNESSLSRVALFFTA